MALGSMALRGDPLAAASEQLRVLHSAAPHLPFDRALAEAGLAPLQAAGIQVLQVNVGRVCNQTCVHCHVDAGPDRRESMSREVAEACLRVLDKARIPTLDITGGAPEMNPSFRHLVTQARRLGRHVIDRSNLTILEAPGFRDLPEFLAENGVEIVASLPCYSAKNVDAQRGGGVFDQSIAALRRLNAVGYGQPDSGLMLTLVYNPGGPSLPPPQATLEADYKRELQTRYGVLFNRLFTLTNLPIGRFLHSLVQNGQYDAYMQRLDGGLQSGGGRGRNVPNDLVGRMERPAARLRFQPDARPRAGCRRVCRHPRVRSRAPGPSPHPDWPALLRLHGRRRFELPRGDSVRKWGRVS